MGKPVTTDQLIAMTPELAEEAKIILDLVGTELVGLDFFKRTKKFINGKGNEATRPLRLGEEPDFRTCCGGLKIKAFNVGGKPAYDRAKKGLFHFNLFNEVTRAKMDSHGSAGYMELIEIRHGGFVYHRNNNFKPVSAVGFIAPLLEA